MYFGFKAEVKLDSINHVGVRLTTIQLTYPRIIHSELMTHRMFSRNAASSRAIPVEKMLKMVEQHPFVPLHWGANQKGMQARAVLPPQEQLMCEELWLAARDEAVAKARALLKVGLHKQIANRLLEPFSWITVLVSSTNYSNFAHLRVHQDAEPHFHKIAKMAMDAINDSCPRQLIRGDIHAPFIGVEGDEELDDIDIKKVSTGRCARISYLTHEGKRDNREDIRLHDDLARDGHWSPFEHVATVSDEHNLRGNFGIGWVQYRKTFASECR